MVTSSVNRTKKVLSYRTFQKKAKNQSDSFQEEEVNFYSTCHFPMSLCCDACNCVSIMSEHVRTVLFVSLCFMSSESKLPSYSHTIPMLL